MKLFILPLALAMSTSAVAEDEWVSVGAAKTVAPAQADVVIPASTSSLGNDPQSGGDLMSELLVQIEYMQQEIAQLRSQVETQQQQLQTLEHEQQARYLDLDRRVSSLVSQPASVATTPDGDKTDVVIAPADAYKAAMALVREKKFAEANEAFTAFTKNYPQDKLTANAWYWNGEVYLVQNKLEQAKAAFEQVMNQYADHQKAADAGYKLGVTLHKLGEDQQAKDRLTQVIEYYSGKADATVRLAKSYLSKINAAQ